MQDEAFVIGYTMGNDEKVKDWELKFYKAATKLLYPKKYSFNDITSKVFDLGVKFGKENGIKNIHNFPFEEHHRKSIAELRNLLGICENKLSEYFKKEKAMFPNEISSQRLLHQ